MSFSRGGRWHDVYRVVGQHINSLVSTFVTVTVCSVVKCRMEPGSPFYLTAETARTFLMRWWMTRRGCINPKCDTEPRVLRDTRHLALHAISFLSSASAARLPWTSFNAPLAGRDDVSTLLILVTKMFGHNFLVLFRVRNFICIAMFGVLFVPHDCDLQQP